MTTPKVLICPYCGETQAVRETCQACGGLFEPLSRQATHNAMGPWYVRDETTPFRPGCSYETLVSLIERGRVARHTILRGPTTKQFWNVARRVPGIAHLFGYCHRCSAAVEPTDHGCHACGTPFGAFLDRNYLGLPDIRPLPWEADGDEEAAGSAPTSRGISSFGSDAELTGGAVAAAERAALIDPAPAPAPRSHPPAPARAAAPAPDPESERRLGAAQRSMQRRIAGQTRTIRVLLFGLVLSVACTVVLAALALGPRLPAGDTAVPAPPSASAPPPPEPAGDPGPAEPATGARDAAPPEPEPQAPAWQADWTRARALIEAAADAERPTADRRADYESALAIVRRLETDVPAEAHPEDLAARAAEIETAIERLELEAFFP